MEESQFKIGIVIFQNVTALDFIGPQEFFSWIPNSHISIISCSLDPVIVESGLRFLPDESFEDADWVDLLFVPGGSGINDQLANQPMREFLLKQSAQAKYICSVCTGSLLLAAAGLL